MEKKRSSDEKKYVILSKESIQCFADAAGHPDIQDDVLSLLAEDVIYRLREATHNSCQYMRHSKRKKLTVEHFNKALSDADVPPLLGHCRLEDPVYHQTRDGELCYEEDSEVNLLDLTNELTVVQPCEETKVTASWLAVEGVQKTSGQANENPSKVLEEDQQNYYEQIIKASLSENVEISQAAYTDLRTNSRLSSVLSHLVQYISTNVRQFVHDIGKCMKLLRMTQAIIKNQSIYLEPSPYLKVLIDTICCCLLEPSSGVASLKYNHWMLRDLASRLLPQITVCWHNTVNGLMEHSLQILKDVLYDHTRPFTSHYGAITALSAFGLQALEEIFLPHMNRYWHHLSAALSDQSRTKVYMNAHRVFGAVMLAAELLIRAKSHHFLLDCINKTDTEPTKPLTDLGAPVLSPAIQDLNQDEDSRTDGRIDNKSTTDHFTHQDLLGPVLELPDAFTAPKYTLTDMYLQFADRFGDSLVARLPYIEQLPIEVYQLPQQPDFEQLVKLGYPEDKKSGEELLQSFLNDGSLLSRHRDYDRLHDDCDIDYDFEDRSDHSSRSDQSDLLNFLGDDTDVTVKNIDQSHGIKLIFSKKPKTKPTPESEREMTTPTHAPPPAEEATPMEVEKKEASPQKSVPPILEPIPEKRIEYKTTRTIIQTVDDEEDGYTGNVFDNYVPVQQRTVLFEFVYAGISKACEYVEKRRITIEMDTLTEQENMNKVHELCQHLSTKGRPLLPAAFKYNSAPQTARQRWARTLHSCSLRNSL